MKKTLSAFVTGLVVASVPYLLMTRADAQGAGPGQRGGQGQFQGGPAQIPPGQPGPGNPGGFQQGFAPITSITVDGDHVYAGAGNWLYKIGKNDMKVLQQVSLRPPQRMERQPGGPGGK